MRSKLIPVLLAALTTLAVTTPAEASDLRDLIVSPDMSTAMQRDLGLTEAQVRLRLAQEAEAAKAETQARKELGDRFAGAWFDANTGKLVVRSTHTVKHSLRTLDNVKAQLDKLNAPKSVTGWYVDVRTNAVVVTVHRNTDNDFVSKAKAIHESVQIKETTEQPRTTADVVGGYPYYINDSSRCSIGFAVYGGFVTAGHCGRPGARTTSHNNELLGYFSGSVFPGNDHGWVRTEAGVNLYALVYGYDGYYYYVYGSNEAPVGSGICRSGSTTGMHCGTIQAKNQTVNYPQGTVYGLTQTNVCAEGGDSGGSWLSANQAQGVTSGGSGNCTSGGTTYYQPLNPILSHYGLTLITA